MKTYYDYLIEAESSPRIPHPEDSVFSGSATGLKYARALQEVATDSKQVSIKWDGMIALYFGRDQSGRFFINDKYMPETFYAYSPADWQRYDTEIKRSRTPRPDLYRKIALIWPGLEAAVGNTSGTFKGDLMFIGPLEPVAQEYVFKPVTVEYRVPVNSELGRLIAGRKGLIVAHQYNNQPWTGRSFGNKDVTVIRPDMGIQFKIRNPVGLAMQAEQSVSGQRGQLIDQFLAGLPKTVQAAINRYFNHLATGQTRDTLEQWLPKEISARQVQNLFAEDGYLRTNAQGYQALWQAWSAIGAYKNALAQQLESQVTGFSQRVDGQPGGEGFVFPSSAGLIKLVQKGSFGAAHFAGFAAGKK